MIVCAATSSPEAAKARLAWLPADQWTARVVEAPDGLEVGELRDWVKSRLRSLFHADPSTLCSDAVRLGDGRVLVIAARAKTLEELRSRAPRARIMLAILGPWKAEFNTRVVVLPDAYELVTIGASGQTSGGIADQPAISIHRQVREGHARELDQILERMEPLRPFELFAEGRDLAALRRDPPPGAVIMDLAGLGKGLGSAFPRRSRTTSPAAMHYAILASVSIVAGILLQVAREDIASRENALAARRAEFSSRMTEMIASRESGIVPPRSAADSIEALSAFAALAGAEDSSLRADRVSVEGDSFSFEGTASDAIAALDAIRKTGVFTELKLRGVSMIPGPLERFSLSGRIDDGE